MSGGLPRFAGVAIFTLALGVLVLEVALTRVFSVMTYHHFTYVIIALALLGFGAAGTWLTVSPRFRGPGVDTIRLADAAWGFGLSTALSLLAITKTRFDAVAMHTDRDLSEAFGMLMLLVFAATPFFFGGLCIGYLISKAGKDIGRIYFSDLVGAGVGSLLALVGVNYAGAPGSILLVAVLACGVAMLLGGRVNGRIRWRYPVTLVALMAMAGAAIFYEDAIPVPVPPSEGVDWRETEHRWHVVARTDVGRPLSSYANFSGALSRNWEPPKPPIEHIAITQDGRAFTGLVKLEGRQPGEIEALGQYMQGSGYVLHPGGRVLVIGPGGGVDVAIALHHGAGQVWAVDINPWTLEYVKGKYDAYAGGLYNRPNVQAINSEGRHFLTAREERFDVIQLSGVDTFTALSSGALALSENYLYTREALRDFLNHLTDDGALCFSRWLFSPPRETLRLVVTARTVLDELQVADPASHVVVLAAPAWHDRAPWAQTMIKRQPFTPEELERLRSWATERRFDILYDPAEPYAPGGSYDQIESTSKYDPAICAREFSRALRSAPEELQSYVAGYEYNIRPATDDWPFFFDYYGFKNLANPFAPSKGGFPITRLPLALMILPGVLLAILVLGGIFILMPLRGQAAALRSQPGKLPVLVYFSAVGLAFICVEIMFLQKLMVFLGGPVYSMAVTLFSILVFCGIGARLTRHFSETAPRGAGVLILIVLAAAIFGATWFLNEIVPQLMHLSHWLRCVVAVAALMPVSLLMGMPFPTGLRLTERVNEQLVPWAWSVNAIATVLGSIGAAFLALLTGYTTVLNVGIGIYLVALVALMLVPRIRIPETVSPAPVPAT